jgi:hypothetical protein
MMWTSLMARNKENSDISTNCPKYAIGSTTIFIHDDTRGFDPIGGITDGIRVLPAEIWYPVDKKSVNKSLKRARFSDYFFGLLSAFRFEMTFVGHGFDVNPNEYKPGTTLADYEAALVKRFNSCRRSFLNAPISRDGPFPAVILHHGGDDHRFSFNFIGEFLAENGYIAIAIDVTGNAGVSQVGFDPNYPAVNIPLVPLNADESYTPQFPFTLTGLDFLLNTNGDAGVKFFQALEQYRQDDISMIKELFSLNSSTGNMFEGKIDVNKIGFSGASLGGIVGRISMETISELKAGFLFVPIGLPNFTPIFLEAQQNTGIDYIAQIANLPSWIWNSTHGVTPDTKPLYFWLDGQDQTSNIFATIFALVGVDVPPTEENPSPDVQRAFTYSVAPAFYSSLVRTNHAFFIYSSSPFFLFHDIAQDVFPQVFHPELDYTLLGRKCGLAKAESRKQDDTILCYIPQR